MVTTTLWASGSCPTGGSGGNGGGATTVTVTQGGSGGGSGGNGGSGGGSGGGGSVITYTRTGGDVVTATQTMSPSPTGGSGGSGNSTSYGQCAMGVVGKINVIQSDITVLLNEVVDYENGGLDSILALLKIQLQTMTVGDAVSDAGNSIASCPPFSDMDTALVASALLKVIPNIKAVLQALQDKKDDLDKAILGIASAGFIVEADLKSLKSKTDDMADNLADKSSDWIQGALDDLVSQIDDWFDTAIQKFENDPIISL